ncbi:hypothetical protein ACLM5H_26495, partial [Fredinandcohnia humi]
SKKRPTSSVGLSFCLATSYSHRGNATTTIGAEALLPCSVSASDELRISASAALAPRNPTYLILVFYKSFHGYFVTSKPFGFVK